VIQAVLKQMHNKVNGLVHCSGGGQTKILHFVHNLHVVKDNLFPVNELFGTIQQQSGTEWREMYQVFNMGHRMECYVPDQQSAEEIIAIAGSYGIAAKIIGHCEPANNTSLTIKTDQGVFSYPA
jgi:phosphoribosylformylglycinamidine cyclo-ligase